MNSNYANSVVNKLVCFVLFCCLPLIVKSTTDETIGEQHRAVAMRKIGHEILMCVGDYDSRVLPIEKLSEEQYKISFATKLGFDPGDVIPIVDAVMLETRAATDYLIEIQDCVTEEMVHAAIRSSYDLDEVVCDGRILPHNCYHLLITILEHARYYPNQTVLADREAIWAGWPAPGPLRLSAVALVLLAIVALWTYWGRKKSPAPAPAGVIKLGASRFDPQRGILSFADKRVELSHKEASLLAVLCAAANTPVERALLLREVWGDEGDYIGRTLDVFISKLRKKLAADTSVKIINIRGVGYKLVVDAA